MKERRHLAFFDCAYQGFATGDLEADAWSVRHFADEVGLEVLVSQSFGKNMGLYGERIGYLSGVVASASVIPALQSQLMLVVRPMYSNPAGHGAMIVGRILGDEARYSAWASELKANVDRVRNIRVLLRQLLEKDVPQRDWSSITKQIGMFWYERFSAAFVTSFRSSNAFAGFLA
jgi:aspartate/tyrosine/aromatic aminotransferase